MQDKKAKIHALYDPKTGDLLAEVLGGNNDLCFLMGTLVAQLAQSHASVAGCTKEDALAGSLAKIILAAMKYMERQDRGVTIDLSRKYEED